MKQSPWRRVGQYIGRDVVVDGRRSTELLHRWIVEQVIGRQLRPDEHVHHANENKLDNRLANLELLSRAEHTRRHFATGRTMVTLTCSGCAATFERDVRRRNSKFCSRSCSAREGGRVSGAVRSGRAA